MLRTNLDWYRVFYVTATQGSFSKAAAALFITQPAVSYAIKQLEMTLGGKLFSRTPKGVALTAEGEVLFKHIEQAYGFLAAAERKVAEMHQMLRGEVRIGAGDSLCKHYLLPYLESFHASFPDIKIQVTNRTSLETVQLLKEGKIDFGIVNLPIEDKQIQIREIAVIQDCFVAGEKYKHVATKPVSMKEMSEYPIILLEKGSSSRRYIDRYVQLAGLDIQPEIELGSVDLLVQFARIGLGISCVVKDYIRDELRQGILYEIVLEDPIPPRSIGIITSKEMPLSVAATQFLQLLQT